MTEKEALSQLFVFFLLLQFEAKFGGNFFYLAVLVVLATLRMNSVQLAGTSSAHATQD